MSRCFPFPPPGYEKKARPDENLLAKEKHKKEKNKKDKKDRERREGKKKNDKERSKEKRREKKDRKEKIKDKRDKNGEQEKKRTSDEKNTAGPPECRNGYKLGSNCMQSNETNDLKFLLELGNRIRVDDRATPSRAVQKITLTGQRSAELPGKVLESTAGKLAEGNEMRAVQKITITGQRSAELPGKVVECSTGKLAEGNEKFKDKREDAKKVYGQNRKVDTRATENGSVHTAIGDEQRKVERVAGLADKFIDKGMEKKEKNKRKNSESRGDGHKDRDGEKKSKSKDKKREKEKEKEKAKEKVPDKEQLKPRENNKNAVDIHNIKSSILLKESNKVSGSEGNLGKRKELEIKGYLHDIDIRPNKLLRPVSSSRQVVENGRILEPCKTATQFVSEGEGTLNNHNGNNKVSSSLPVEGNERKVEPCPAAIQFASESQGTGTNHKVNNKVLSSHPPLENGRKLELCRIPTQLSSGRQGWVGNPKVEIKEHRINGLIEAQQPNVCFKTPSRAPLKVEENVKASVKPPHPDSKYLSQILHVPSIEWSDFDDQEWLFGSNDLQAEKPRLGSSQMDGTKQVWAEALRVESADVTALPYVIPY